LKNSTKMQKYLMTLMIRMNMTQSRQKQYYRLKNWTMTLYDENGAAYLVNPNQVMLKKEQTDDPTRTETNRTQRTAT
jgi:hypothetical protein